MTTTSQLRSWWAPACRGPWTSVDLNGNGVVVVKSSIVNAVLALDKALQKYHYTTRYADTGAYNCRAITGGSLYSLHAYGVAIDINWQTNPYGRYLRTDMPKAMRDEIKAIRTNNGRQVWRWGGDYTGNKDAMHWEITCSPYDLQTGINKNTIPKNTVLTPTPTPKPPVIPKDPDDMPIIILAKDRQPRLLDAPLFVPLDPVSQLGLVAQGIKQATVSAADYDEIREQVIRALDET